MSVFNRSFLSLCKDPAHVAVTEDGPGTEVAEGVVVERRSVLWLSATAVAAALATTTRVAAQDKSKPASGSEKLTFEQFLEQVSPLAQQMVAAKSQDDAAYLLTVAAALSRLRDPGPNLRKTMRTFAKKHGRQGQRFPLSAMSMNLKAGGGFKPHDHRNYNGVILGLSGELRIRNFEIQGDEQVPAADQTFQIRETRDDLILPGRVSSVGLRRDNIHELVAGKEGARVLDVFTFFGGGGSHYLDVEAKPRDQELRIYDATWRPRRSRRRR